MKHFKLKRGNSGKNRTLFPKRGKIGMPFPNLGNINLKLPNQGKTSQKKHDLDEELLQLESQLLQNEEALLNQGHDRERRIQNRKEMDEKYPSLIKERKDGKSDPVEYGNKPKNKAFAKQAWKVLMGQIPPHALSPFVSAAPETRRRPYPLELGAKGDTESGEKPLHSSFMQEVNHAMSAVSDSLRRLLSAGPSTPPEASQREEIRKRFATRGEALHAVCQQHANSSLFRPLSVEPIFRSAYHPLMNSSVRYCPIEKTGSTTWRRILNKIEKEARPRNTHAQTNDAGPGKTGHALEGGQGFSGIETSIVFVREPYTRLLSAYTDKLFSPNTLFWSNTGRYIITNFRNSTSVLSRLCGHNVTFPEFIRYVIHAKTTGDKRDGHFSPIHDHCDFCRTHYDFIGHMETFQEDLDFLLDALHSNITYTAESFEQNTVKNNAEWVFKKMRTDIEYCITMDEAAKRLWKKWQIRGLVSKEDPLPLVPGEAEAVEMNHFVDMAYAAVVRSGGTSKLKKQKIEALREAYSTVPLADRLQLKDIFYLDFKMFGYDPEPDFVFPTSPYAPTDEFRYLQL